MPSVSAVAIPKLLLVPRVLVQICAGGDRDSIRADLGPFALNLSKITKCGIKYCFFIAARQRFFSRGVVFCRAATFFLARKQFPAARQRFSSRGLHFSAAHVRRLSITVDYTVWTLCDWCTMHTAEPYKFHDFTKNQQFSLSLK